MTDAVGGPSYVVVVQCHIVKERCSGYLCELAFHERSGGFEGYPAEGLRLLTMTCGGCCGRAVHRKLANLLRQLRKREGVGKDRVVVHLSSCVANDNFHGPPCPHKDYLRTLIADRLGLALREGSRVSPGSAMRRKNGVYRGRDG